jgi:hypothetical protein
MIHVPSGADGALDALVGAWYAGYLRCLRVIKGYEHYREGTCVLFDDAEIARWNQQWDPNMIWQEALIAQQQFWPADEVRVCLRCCADHGRTIRIRLCLQGQL